MYTSLQLVSLVECIPLGIPFNASFASAPILETFTQTTNNGKLTSGPPEYACLTRSTFSPARRSVKRDVRPPNISDDMDGATVVWKPTALKKTPKRSHNVQYYTDLSILRYYIRVVYFPKVQSMIEIDVTQIVITYQFLSLIYVQGRVPTVYISL